MYHRHTCSVCTNSAPLVDHAYLPYQVNSHPLIVLSDAEGKALQRKAKQLLDNEHLPDWLAAHEICK